MNTDTETPAAGRTISRNRRICEARRLAAAGVSAPTIAALMAEWQPRVDAERETHLEHVADCALVMARAVRSNPQRVWEVLCHMDTQTLRETTMVALLGLPAHQPKTVLWEGIA